VGGAAEVVSETRTSRMGCDASWKGIGVVMEVKMLAKQSKCRSAEETKQSPNVYRWRLKGRGRRKSMPRRAHCKHWPN